MRDDKIYSEASGAVKIQPRGLHKRMGQPFQKYFPLAVCLQCYYAKQRMPVCCIHVGTFRDKAWLLLLHSDKEKSTDYTTQAGFWLA